MGLFKKGQKKSEETKCKECGMECYEPERLQRHMKKAHSRPSQKRADDEKGGTAEGGLW